MRSRLSLPVAALAALASCSNDNEGGAFANWFTTNDRPETLVPVEEELVVDNRPLVPRVTDLRLEKTTSGLIVRAVGQTPAQGYWQPGLVLRQRDGRPQNGVLGFDFRAAPPVAPLPGPARAREISAGRFISTQQLRGVREIRVYGQDNFRSARP